MVSCSVYFYRRVLGLRFAAPQGKIEIRAARDEARAVQAAKQRFARRLKLQDWQLAADCFDVVCPEASRAHVRRATEPLYA